MSFDEPMSSHMFDKLTTCDPGLAWELCRNYVGFQLLGRDPVTVPFLDEAYHYVPFGIIVKRNKRAIPALSLLPEKSSYTIIGAMPHLLAPGVDKTPFRQRPERVTDYTFNSRYVYRVSGMKNGVKKAIKIKVNGTECFDVSISMELGKLVLDSRLPELQDVRKIYVIYEVFYAQSISVSVTIGEQQPGTKYMDTNNRKFSQDRRIPIGFSAQKFPIMSNGCVGFLEKSSLDGLRDGKWKRVSRLKSDPLPIAPSTYPYYPTRCKRLQTAKRNPRDLLPGIPTTSRYDDLPPLPQTSSSSSS